MPLPFYIAKKYSVSKQGSKFLSLISVITVIGIAIGTAVLIISLTILDGYQEVVTKKIVDFNSHIKITAFGNKNLPDSPRIEEEIITTVGKDFKSIAPYVSKLGILRAKKLSEGVTIFGIDSTRNNSDIKDFIVEGKYSFMSGEKNGIIIGRQLAEKLDIKIGDRVTLFSLRRDEIPSMVNPPAIEQFITTGLYESGMAEYDDINVYTSFQAARNMFETQYAISGYNIQLTNIAEIDSVARRLQDELGFPYYVRTIFQVHQNIFTWLELQKAPIPIVLGLIIIVAVFNIVGTLLMIVLERTSSIGILKSMGFKRRQIMMIFFYQGLFLTLLGIIIGNILAVGLSLLQVHYNIVTLPSSIYFLSSVPISINMFNYLMVSSIAFILGLAATLIPSYIASKMNPINSIRFN